MPFVKTYVLRMNTEVFVFYSQMRVYYKITLITWEDVPVSRL